MHMRGIYKETPECQSCLDYFDGVPAGGCKRCMEYHRHSVGILEVGVGFFGDKAVIRTERGELKTVKLNELTIIEEEEYRIEK